MLQIFQNADVTERVSAEHHKQWLLIAICLNRFNLFLYSHYSFDRILSKIMGPSYSKLYAWTFQN